MSAKPELAFDVCWDIYRGARETLDEKRRISALNPTETQKYLWRPNVRAQQPEFVADFALAGKKALAGPEWASRLTLFNVYYLSLAPYEQARRFLGIGEMTWVQWTEQIRARCGTELLWRGLFPPAKYFKGSENIP